LGQSGEEIAKNYLADKNYKIVGQNIRLKMGEIDLLALDGDFLVLVEVKTKTSFAQGLPEEKVDYFKQKKLRLLARALAQNYPDKSIRIDVVAVDMSGDEPKINHVVNAVEEI
ncbi:MAG: YraN family protein, partial [Patescibacteria group bacterium]|nr:YraN family protein [Patescibacteria group bacterium]